jgi:hypothetical protein
MPPPVGCGPVSRPSSAFPDDENRCSDAKAKVSEFTERKNELLPKVGELNRDIRIADEKATGENVSDQQTDTRH